MLSSLPLLIDEVIFYVEENWMGGQKKGIFIVPKGTKRKEALALASVHTYGFILKDPQKVVNDKETILIFLDRDTKILGKGNF